MGSRRLACAVLVAAAATVTALQAPRRVALAPAASSAPARRLTLAASSARRQTSLRAGDDDDIDFDAAFRARLEEDDVVPLPLPETVEEALDYAKMVILGGQGVAAAVAAIVGSLSLLSAGARPRHGNRAGAPLTHAARPRHHRSPGIYLSGAKDGLKGSERALQPIVEVDTAKVCITCKGNDERSVKALQFSADELAKQRFENGRGGDPSLD
jgi:hypothetical protein